jgi:uncharacterized protein (TIGR03435 family)
MSGRALPAAALACLLALGAQTPQSFEVAAIKPSDPTSPVGIRRFPGGRFATTNTSLRLLITWTYDIGDERLAGAPASLDSAHFDVTAKAADPNATLDDLHAMMKSLLADRFKLQVHTATRDLPMYALEVDKNGPKVHARDAPLAVNHDPFKMTESGRLTGTSVTPTMLAKVLTNQLGHYVSDNTGFHSAFDFTLEWRPDSAASGDNPAADARPSIFNALREQLGFKLTSGKAPVEVIAIDHVDNHPTDN